MRITQAIVGSMAALILNAAPALARNADAQKPVESAASETSSSCSARQQMADGSWASLPCQEVGAPAQARPAGRRAETAGH